MGGPRHDWDRKCAVGAGGIYGAVTVSRRILWVQAAPAAIALALLWLAVHPFTFAAGIALHCHIRSSTIPASDGGRRNLNMAPDRTIGQSRP
jgi:hypothetical protein